MGVVVPVTGCCAEDGQVNQACLNTAVNILAQR